MINLAFTPVLLTRMMEANPSPPISWISSALGFVLNFLFQFVYTITESGSLGISIILLTVFARLLMIPQGLSSQQSMAVSQRLTPEVEKIKKKYGDTKDPELTRKRDMEIQALYSKNGANPIVGCLPLLITMPIFIALFAVLKSTYLYVTPINELYTSIAEIFVKASDGVNGLQFFENALEALVKLKIPKNLNVFVEGSTYAQWVSDMTRFVNACTPAELAGIVPHLPSNLQTAITPLLSQKASIETFLTVDLISNSGWGWPGITIPILTALSQLLTSFVSMRQTKSGDPQQMQTQKIMMFAMPVMMIFFTVNAAAGVGIYWITSSVFAAAQQFALGKYYTKERLDRILEKKSEKKRLKKERKNGSTGLHRG